MSDSADDLDELRRLLRIFVNGVDRSIGLAGEIETRMRGLFPDDPRFEDFVDQLAQYQPGGGEFLYNDEQLLPSVRWVLAQLEVAKS
jgi:hypothetical protein